MDKNQILSSIIKELVAANKDALILEIVKTLQDDTPATDNKVAETNDEEVPKTNQHEGPPYRFSENMSAQNGTIIRGRRYSSTYLKWYPVGMKLRLDNKRHVVGEIIQQNDTKVFVFDGKAYNSLSRAGRDHGVWGLHRFEGLDEDGIWRNVNSFKVNG